jgi:hypothetical protein
MAGYSSPFIPHYSEKTARLRDLLVEKENRWTDEHQKAFEELKEYLSSEITCRMELEQFFHRKILW